MKTLIFFCLVLSLLTNCFAKTTLSRNSLDEINACKGKVELSLVRIWNNEDSDDENQFFKFPMDVKIGKDGLVYIVDTDNHRIQVFDR